MSRNPRDRPIFLDLDGQEEHKESGKKENKEEKKEDRRKDNRKMSKLCKSNL